MSNTLMTNPLNGMQHRNIKMSEVIKLVKVIEFVNVVDYRACERNRTSHACVRLLRHTLCIYLQY